MPEMRSVDLGAATTVVICPEPDGLRGRHMRAMLDGLGLPFGFETGLYRVEGRPSLPKTADLTLNYVRTLFRNRDRLPLLVLEDDCRVTEAFRPRLEVPADADVVYLGVSRWGVVPEVIDKGILGGILLRDWGAGHVRIYNMLQAHAVLYLTRRGLERMATAAIEALCAERAHDTLLARAQRSIVTLAPRLPLFYQADDLQTERRRGFLRQEANSRIELVPPGVCDALEVHLEGAVHRLRIAADARGDPEWRRVEAFGEAAGRVLRIALTVSANGKTIACRRL